MKEVPIKAVNLKGFPKLLKILSKAMNSAMILKSQIEQKLKNPIFPKKSITRLESQIT